MAESRLSYLDVLNPEQREAVLHTGRPLLILAGAGSGKTRVITTKIAWLIREMGEDPRSILAVTFTNKAAREMAGRAAMIDSRASQAMLRTFHSFGAWFLRRNGSAAGLEPGFIIYDDDDSVALLSTIMEGAPRADVKAMATRIAWAKDYFLSPDDPELDSIDSRAIFRKTYARYEEKLSRIGNVDFGDLIKKPVEILRSSGEIARRFRDRFSVIMVDEYQDANVAQSRLLKELYGPGAYLCVVGDDDQSIYRFRGAEVRNILKFPESFDGADIIRLVRNYRSTAPILRAAASVVDCNKGRLGKELRAERGGGKKPVLAFLPDQDTEAEFCAELIQKSGSYSDWAIVYRTNAQSLGFETEFLRKHIPYRVVGSLKFYEREEVKDMLALLSFLVNPRDEIAFRRVVNKPARGVGPATVDRIVDAAVGGDLAVAAKNYSSKLSAKARAGIDVFLRAVEAGRAALGGEPEPSGGETEINAPPSPEARTADGPAPGNPLGNGKARSRKSKGSGGSGKEPGDELFAGVGLSACVVSLAKESGIADYHLNYDEVSGNQRINNLQELANAGSLYKPTSAGLLEFLEHIELDRALDEGDSGDTVTLITLHNTKGLEFRRVIMTGIEQGIFPRDDKEGDDLEEERRLFYVGATRAMDELYFTASKYRRVFGSTREMNYSRFLDEIDKSALRIIGSAPCGFADYAGASSVRKTPGSSDGRWALGDKVYNDDNGYGSITQIREGEDGPIIKVVFETGYETRFLSRHQSSRFTKIKED